MKQGGLSGSVAAGYNPSSGGEEQDAQQAEPEGFSPMLVMGWQQLKRGRLRDGEKEPSPPCSYPFTPSGFEAGTSHWEL